MQQAKSSVDCSESYFTPLDPATAVNNTPTTAGTAEDEWPLKGKKATFMTVAVVVVVIVITIICAVVSVVTVIIVKPAAGTLQANGTQEDNFFPRTVDVFRGCQPESTTCEIYIYYSYGYMYSDYQRNCSTPIQDIDSANNTWYTVDIRCEYNENLQGYTQSATLYRSGNKYYCLCDVVRLDGQSFPSGYYTITCALTLTRCPRSVNLLN